MKTEGLRTVTVTKQVAKTGDKLRSDFEVCAFPIKLCCLDEKPLISCVRSAFFF